MDRRHHMINTISGSQIGQLSNKDFCLPPKLSSKTNVTNCGSLDAKNINTSHPAGLDYGMIQHIKSGRTTKPPAGAAVA
jgi:hypothetical protein